MGDFHEDRIIVNLTLTRNPADGTDHVFLAAASFDSTQNQAVRTIRRREITDKMSAARMTGIKNLLDDAINQVKTEWNIPTLVTGPIAIKPPS